MEKKERSELELIKAIDERTERNLDIIGEFKVFLIKYVKSVDNVTN